MQPMTAARDRYRLLAGLTRSRLLAVLGDSGGSMGVRELADAVGLHPNSVREQLARLADAGLVVTEPAPPSGRGRPGLRYAARPEADEQEPYRALVRVLADELEQMTDPATRAAEAGERWGRALVGPQGNVADEDAAVGRLVGLLADAGFKPEGPDLPGGPIRLRRCPFDPLARDHGRVVCGVHLGLMRGALRQMGAPLDAVALEPYVELDLCLAHLRRRHEARDPRSSIGMTRSSQLPEQPSGGRLRRGCSPP
jgi:predicted ArsR family transcriptional regulator